MDNKLKVKYNSQLNSVVLRDFKSAELDTFYSILSKMKEQGTQEITFTYQELQHLSKYNMNITIDNYTRELERFYAKLISLNFRFEDEDVIERFVLFDRYKVDKKNQYITVRTSEVFKFLLNDFTTFTQFELEEFVDIKSKYAKMLYKLIKQYQNSDYLTFTIGELRERLDIPDSYKTYHINQRVIEPIKKELSPLIEDFSVEAVKGRGREKRKIVRYVFHFEKQKRDKEKYIPNKYVKEYKKTKPKLTDNRMSKAEREAYINKKLTQKLPIKKRNENNENEEIQNIEGQVDMENL